MFERPKEYVLNWFCHIERMSDERLNMKVYVLKMLR